MGSLEEEHFVSKLLRLGLLKAGEELSLRFVWIDLESLAIEVSDNCVWVGDLLQLNQSCLGFEALFCIKRQALRCKREDGKSVCVPFGKENYLTRSGVGIAFCGHVSMN
ncbi:hypothetical protein ABKV19_020594 [Rosa sericea]